MEKGDRRESWHLSGVRLAIGLTDQPQQITVEGKDYDVYLRFKRDYKPYTVTLEKFTHDLYPGTKTPKNLPARCTS